MSYVSFTEENVKRPKKTKRSPIINFFRRSQAKLDGVSSQPSGKLFGHPLKEISQEDSLCKPIMVSGLPMILLCKFFSLNYS